MKAFDQALAKQFLGALSSQLKPQLFRARLSALVASLMLVVSMALLAWWVAESVTLRQVQWAALPWLLGGFLLRYASAAVASYCGQEIAEAAQDNVRQQLLKRWCEADLEQAPRTNLKCATQPAPSAPKPASQGDVDQTSEPNTASDSRSATTERANLLVEPTEQLYGYFARFIPQLTTAVATPLLILSIVLYHDWVAAMFLLVAAPIIPLFMALVGIGAARLSNRHIRTTQRLAGLFVDRVRHLVNLKLFAAETMAVEDIRAASERMRVANMATLRIAFLSSAVLEFFASVAIAAVAIYVGFSLLGYFTFEPAAQMTFLAGFTVLLLAPDFFQPLRNLSAHYHDRADALAAAGLLSQELQYELRCDTGSTLSSATQHQFPNRGQDEHVTESQHRPEPADGADYCNSVALHIVNLNFAYQAPVIANLNLSLHGGDTCLLNGPSGSGKSTLLKLLSGQLVAREGHIRRPRGSHIAYMAQEPYLQAGTVADNLRLVCATASDADMEQALAKAQLNKSLSYPLAERGQGLSGGEQRRLALARMFLHPAQLMLFDEPTAGLDAATATIVVQAIQALQNNNRVLVIASHDPHLEPLATCTLETLR